MTSLDHDERRRQIADTVVRIIAAEGLDAATVRRIAAEVGCSTTIVTHYFSNKKDLILWTYRTLGEFGLRVREKSVAGPEINIVDYLLSMTPVDDLTRIYWRAYVAIWDKALNEADILAELRSWNDAVLIRIEGFIRDLDPGCRDRTGIAKRLLASVMGISIQMLFDPRSWKPEQVTAFLAAEVDASLGSKAS